MAAQTYSTNYKIANNYQNGEDSQDTPVLAVDLNRIPKVLESQLPGALLIMGYGVARNIGGGMEVTAGSGLSVNVAAGLAIVGQSGFALVVDNPGAYNFSDLPANRNSGSPIYLFVKASDGTGDTPPSTESRAAIFRRNDTPTLTGAILLATITTSASAILTVTANPQRFIGASADVANEGRRTMTNTGAMLSTDRDLTMIATTAKGITLLSTAALYALGGDFAFRKVGAGACTLTASGSDIYIMGGTYQSTYPVDDGECIVLSPYMDGSTPRLFIKTSS